MSITNRCRLPVLALTSVPAWIAVVAGVSECHSLIPCNECCVVDVEISKSSLCASRPDHLSGICSVIGIEHRTTQCVCDKVHV